MGKNKRKILSLILSLIILGTCKFNTKGIIKNVTNEFYNLEDLDENVLYIDEDYYDESWNIPYVGRFVPQGVCTYNDYTLVSLYDSFHISNSIVCIFDSENTLINKIDLGMDSHVGAICADEDNNLLWVTGKNGYIKCYEIEDALNKNGIKEKHGSFYVGQDLINYKGISSVAYMTVKDNKLYVGNYVLRGNGILKEFNIDYKDKISLTFEKKYNIPSKVQGICFYELDDVEYILFSRSYGNQIDSMIQIYEFKEDFDYNTSKSIDYYLAPMLEQISINDNKLFGVFEYNACKYRNSDIKEDIFYMDVNKLIKKNEN